MKDKLLPDLQWTELPNPNNQGPYLSTMFTHSFAQKTVCTLTLTDTFVCLFMCLRMSVDLCEQTAAEAPTFICFLLSFIYNQLLSSSDIFLHNIKGAFFYSDNKDIMSSGEM